MKPRHCRFALFAALVTSTILPCSDVLAAPNQAIRHLQTSDWYNTGQGPKVYGLRKFPYPYQAMLALSSDADSETLRKFNLVHRFINTTEQTPLGPGLGLDYADSIFMFNGNNHKSFIDLDRVPMANELTYFRGVTAQLYAADALDHYIRCGWVDTLHTYGDFSRVDERTTVFRRSLAATAAKSLADRGDHIEVWTDHGNKSNVDNFGSYRQAGFYRYQQGEVPGSPYYHTDITIPHGIRFVWPDTSSNQFVRDSVIFPLQLADGRRVWGFWRYTNEHYTSQGAVRWNWTPYGLPEQLTEQHLRALEARHGYAVVAQHLCGTPYPGVLPKDAVAALRLLAAHHHQGKVLVARTSRLLRYNVAQKYVTYDVTHRFGTTYVHIRKISDPVFGTHQPSLDEVRGLTFYTSNPERTVIDLGDSPLPSALVQHNASDGTHPSVGIRWFPSDTADHAVSMPNVP
ncbi:hypothetical protein C7445_108137 [Alicyclobacillus sacchari]|uniref:Uncharacterized protein n=1 Tax=Alicyclobacillus sacchari TaxID=392010 RepID=A0A4R8LL62_9BACL|nr:hypothetical protein [Alicyclobacillus sacchari]TDY45313.1 hypothetical protein C7445_108137 [Alicyclobacillus sacchari]